MGSPAASDPLPLPGSSIAVFQTVPEPPVKPVMPVPQAKS